MGAHARVYGDEQRVLSILLYHSLLISVRQGLSVNLGLLLSLLDQKPTSPSDPPVSAQLTLEVIGVHRISGLFYGCWDLNFVPCDCAARALCQ